MVELPTSRWPWLLFPAVLICVALYSYRHALSFEEHGVVTTARVEGHCRGGGRRYFRTASYRVDGQSHPLQVSCSYFPDTTIVVTYDAEDPEDALEGRPDEIVSRAHGNLELCGIVSAAATLVILFWKPAGSPRRPRLAWTIRPRGRTRRP